MKQKMLLLGAVIFGFLAFVLTYSHISNEKAKLSSQAETIYIIRMSRDKAAGEEIQEQDLIRGEIKQDKGSGLTTRQIPWSQRLSVIGRTLDVSVSRGAPLFNTDLRPITQRQGFTAMIRSGFRAATIPVDNVSSLNYLVQPNDMVDIIGTFRFPEARGDNAIDTVTLVLLQNVKVIAVGNRWGSYAVDPGGMNSQAYSTVTLMLLPNEVELVTFASQKGRLTLSLRNYEETRIDARREGIDFRKLEDKLPKYQDARERALKGY